VRRGLKESKTIQFFRSKLKGKFSVVFQNNLPFRMRKKRSTLEPAISILSLYHSESKTEKLVTFL
jgi:hypothetical protein